jgi:hypothetical protein
MGEHLHQRIEDTPMYARAGRGFSEQNLRVNLGVVASPRNRDICQARVDQLLARVVDFHLNQDAISGSPLPAVAGHGN